MKNKISAIDEIILESGFYDGITMPEEYKHYIGKVDDLNNKLVSLLNEEQNKLLADLLWAYMEVEGSSANTYFKEGFKAGARIVAECFLC